MPSSYIYPYSEDLLVKRQQIWDNLQKGILFVDQDVFIPWRTPYSRITEISEERRDRGDRTNWFFGRHKVLDGYECPVETMKWLPMPWDRPFSQIEVSLGFDDEGEKKFLFLKKYLIDLLGNPSYSSPEEFGNRQIGEYKWENGLAQIYIIGIEQFALKYFLNIGLIQKPELPRLTGPIAFILDKLFPNGL